MSRVQQTSIADDQIAGSNGDIYLVGVWLQSRVSLEPAIVPEADLRSQIDALMIRGRPASTLLPVPSLLRMRMPVGASMRAVAVGGWLSTLSKIRS